MILTTLGDLLNKQQLAFTMYSPDCSRSQLWGNLDHFIYDRTRFQPVGRVWINHDINTISRMYSSPDDPVPPERDTKVALERYNTLKPADIQPGHLTAKHFITGPSLITFWQGEGVIEQLSALKGKTHPAEAEPDTIRGAFWCDNAVLNLTHVSDGYAEVEHELIGANLGALLDKPSQTLPLFEPTVPNAPYMPHCAISIVYDVVRRLSIVQGKQIPELILPQSGNARETQALFSGALRSIAGQFTENSPIKQLIAAYLVGDLVAVMALFPQLPLTAWESFALQCGTLGRQQWEYIESLENSNKTAKPEK